MNHFSDQALRLYNAINELPEKKQQAVLWLIANYDIAVSICKERILTEQERQQYMGSALQKDDMCCLVLLLLERIINS